MSNKLSFKVSYNDDIRRISLENLSFRILQETLSKLFKLTDTDWAEIEIRYKDDEGDMITISADEELEEAVLLCEQQKCPTLRLTLYKKQTVERKTKKFRRCGYRRQWREFHCEALRLFDSDKKEDLEKARELLLKQLSFTPSHPIPLYNLACVESRIHNFTSAISYLVKAVRAGYCDVDHMERDTDLDPIRHLDQFKAIIASLKSQPSDPVIVEPVPTQSTQQDVILQPSQTSPELSTPITPPEDPSQQTTPSALITEQLSVPEPKIVHEEVPHCATPPVETQFIPVEPLATSVQIERPSVSVPEQQSWGLTKFFNKVIYPAFTKWYDNDVDFNRAIQESLQHQQPSPPQSHHQPVLVQPQEPTLCDSVPVGGSQVLVYEEQLTLLLNMGFMDRSKNISALIKVKGDVAAAIDLLA